MFIAVINQSTLVSNDDAQTMCKAIQNQLNLHLLPAWNLKDCKVRFYADQNKIPGYAWVVNLLDNSTVAGALGYHAEDNNKVDAFIFCETVLSNGGRVLYDITNPQNVTVSSVLSHEICEMVGDRFANQWVDGPKLLQGSEYAMELCDPVEGDSYSVDVVVDKQPVKVSLSNFVFPAWFNPQSDGYNMPFDYLKKLKKPFTMTSGGYMIVRKSGRVSEVFGHHMPQWKQKMKKSAWYRR